MAIKNSKKKIGNNFENKNKKIKNKKNLKIKIEK